MKDAAIVLEERKGNTNKRLQRQKESTRDDLRKQKGQGGGVPSDDSLTVPIDEESSSTSLENNDGNERHLEFEQEDRRFWTLTMIVKKLWDEDRVTVVEALSELAVLCDRSEENRRALTTIGGPIVVVNTMVTARHRNCSDVQVEACRALGNFPVDNAAARDLVGRVGGIQAVVAAMRASPDRARLLVRACRALCNNTYRHRRNKSLAVEAGAIESVVAAMNKCPDHSGLQRYACGTLSNLACDGGNEETISEGGGTNRAWRKNKKAKRRVGSSCCGSATVRRMVRAGCVPAIVRAMGVHGNDARVQGNACRALRNMAASDPDAAAAIAVAGGLTALSATAETFLPTTPDGTNDNGKGQRDPSGVREASCRALSTVAKAIRRRRCCS